MCCGYINPATGQQQRPNSDLHTVMVVATSLACCLSLLTAVSLAAPLTNDSGADTCGIPVARLVSEMRNIVQSTSPALRLLGDIPVYAASSCQQVAQLRPGAPSGHYWLQEPSSVAKVFCEMDGRPSFGQDGVWSRLARVNMTEPNSKCPAGLEMVSSPKRLCRSTVSGGGCSRSVFFPSHDIPYSRVCGKIIGYQYYSPDAFWAFQNNQALTLDGVYVDGISLTYGTNPRNHIWTFAAALDETPGHNVYSCFCTNEGANVAFTGVIPPFIGTDYFCETGSRVSYQNRWYLDDPLWDGEGCGRFSTCCDRESGDPPRPWFCKDLPGPTTDSIELRICRGSGHSDEDIGVEVIELYVQ